MSSYWFFFSYARSDRDAKLGVEDHIHRFYEDLCKEVEMQPKENDPPLPPDHETGFFDTKTIQTGATWEPEIEEALRTSRVMVSLCSPAYFTSEYCGKEFRVFLDRRNEYISRSASAEHPPMIQPILWGRPGVLPEIIRKLQYSNDAYPPIYAGEGLRYMMRLDGHKDDYAKFTTQLARMIVATAEKHPLPHSPKGSPIAQIKSAFHCPAGQATAHEESSGANRPTSAGFVFVAASSKAFTNLKLKTAVHYYGEEGRKDWCPYLPDEPVLFYALDAAKKHHLWPRELPVGKDLLEKLEQSNRRREPVIILLDPWTLQIRDYQEIMRDVGRRAFRNCAVMVPWYKNDEETEKIRAELETILNDVFEIKVMFKKSIHYQDSIDSETKLKNRLLRTLAQIRGKLIAEGEAKRKVENDQIVQEARAKGIVVDTHPTLSGPAGNES